MFRNARITFQVTGNRRMRTIIAPVEDDETNLDINRLVKAVDAAVKQAGYTAFRIVRWNFEAPPRVGRAWSK